MKTFLYIRRTSLYNIVSREMEGENRCTLGECASAKDIVILREPVEIPKEKKPRKHYKLKRRLRKQRIRKLLKKKLLESAPIVVSQPPGYRSIKDSTVIVVRSGRNRLGTREKYTYYAQ